MAQSRVGLGQMLGVVVGAVVLAGASGLAGGVVGYHAGKADGQALAQAEQHTAIQTPAGSGNQPFGFRLPSNPGGGFGLPQPLPFEGEIPREFSAPKAYLGVRFEPIDAELAKQEKLGVIDGAIIRDVIAGSPAATADVRVGDVVTAVNGEPVNAERTLHDRIAAHKPNDSIELTLLRGSETLKISVTLGESKSTDVDGFQFRVPDGGKTPFFGDPSNCLPRGEQG